MMAGYDFVECARVEHDQARRPSGGDPAMIGQLGDLRRRRSDQRRRIRKRMVEMQDPHRLPKRVDHVVVAVGVEAVAAIVARRRDRNSALSDTD